MIQRGDKINIFKYVLVEGVNTKIPDSNGVFIDFGITAEGAVMQTSALVVRDDGFLDSVDVKLVKKKNHSSLSHKKATSR